MGGNGLSRGNDSSQFILGCPKVWNLKENRNPNISVNFPSFFKVGYQLY
jgi:hypothetical protein